jgi:hypothetical protein
VTKVTVKCWDYSPSEKDETFFSRDGRNSLFDGITLHDISGEKD